MSVQKLPGGTRGTRQPPGWVGRLMTPLMLRIHRRQGDHFREMDLLYLTTVGAKSGETRTNAVPRFADGVGGWIIVTSANRMANPRGWYCNNAAHPDQVRGE